MPKFRNVFLPAIFFGLLYWAIIHYDRSIAEYRDTLSTGAMVVANLLLVSYWVLDKRSYILPVGTALYWLAFFALGFLSASFAVNTQTGFEQLRLYFSVFLLGLGFRAWIGKPAESMVVGLLLAVCLVHVLILILVLGYATGMVSDPLTDSAAVPYHGNIRHVAHHGMVAACAGLALFFIGGRFRLLGYLLGAASIFGLVFLGQRGGLLGLGVFLFAAAFFLPNLRFRLVAAGLLPILVSVGIVYSLDGHGIANRYAGSIVERARVGGAEAITGSSGRLEIWKSSLALAFERPLLGHGPDGFRASRIGQSYRHIVQSHNLFLQVFVEMGATGLLLVSLFLYQLLRQPLASLLRARRNGTADMTHALLFAAFMGFMIVSLVEGLFYHSVSLLVISVLAPLTFAVAKNTEPTSSVSKSI